MRGVWIGGWGVAPERLRPLAQKAAPSSNHLFLPPTESSVELALTGDFVVGWSFGAWRILNAAAGGAQFKRALLLTPFVGFCAEHGLGGRIAGSKVKWLLRWLNHAPLAALADFYHRAGLGAPPTALPYDEGDLREGLESIMRPPSPELLYFAARGLPDTWVAVAGGRDPLLDPAGICASLKGCRTIVGATHAPEDFMDVIEEFARAL